MRAGATVADNSIVLYLFQLYCYSSSYTIVTSDQAVWLDKNHSMHADIEHNKLGSSHRQDHSAAQVF